eukprot:13648753-Ditylum_brightwellii.AAC.1
MSIKKQFLNKEREQIITFSFCMADVTTKIKSIEEALEKIMSNLHTVTQTDSKFETKLTTQKEINPTQQKEINRYISDIKLNKAISDTKQVATKLSEACNKATSLKFQ